MVKTSVMLLTAVVALLVFPGAASADETAACSFAGTVTLNGTDVPDGTVIKALIGDDEYTTTTPTGYGASTYSITIQSPEGTTYPEGTEVSFTIKGYPADQTSAFQAGRNIRKDLTASTPPVTSPFSAAPTNVWLIVGLVFTCVVEVSVVAGVARIVISDWTG